MTFDKLEDLENLEITIKDEIEDKEIDINTDSINNSELLTCFLLLNSMIGSGILNQPQVFQLSGIVAAILMLSVAACFMWLGLNVLIECGVAHGKLDYSELAREAYGDVGERIVDIAIVVGNFGALLSYLDVIGGTSSQLLYSWGCDSNNNGCSAYLTTSILVFIFILPVCLLRHFGHLAIYSIISMFAIGSVLVLVVIAGPIKSIDGHITLFSSGAGSKLGSIIFTLSCAFAAFPTYKSMKDANTVKWSKVTSQTIVIGYSMCVVMGVAGYLSFKDTTDGLIVSNFKGHYADFFKLLLIIHLIL